MLLIASTLLLYVSIWMQKGNILLKNNCNSIQFTSPQVNRQTKKHVNMSNTRLFSHIIRASHINTTTPHHVCQGSEGETKTKPTPKLYQPLEPDTITILDQISIWISHNRDSLAHSIHIFPPHANEPFPSVCWASPAGYSAPGIRSEVVSSA